LSSALVITVDGTVAELEWPAAGPDGEHPSILHFMYRMMGCDTVDVVRLAPGLDMWLDDYGMGLQPVNPLATMLARAFGYMSQPYYGTVLLSGVDGFESVGLSPRKVMAARRFLNSISGVLL